MSVSSEESERSYIYMSYGYRCSLFYDFFLWYICAVHFIPDRRVSFYLYVFYIISSYFYIYHFSIGFWDFTDKYDLVFWDFTDKYGLVFWDFTDKYGLVFWDFTDKYGLVFWDFHPMTNFVWVITLEWQLWILWRHVIYMCILTQGYCLKI